MCHSTPNSLPNTNTNNNIFTPLIPKTPTTSKTTQTQTNKASIISTTLIKEAKLISKVSVPMALTGLLLYSRSLISVLFLGRLGPLSLAGGSLAAGLANITGYSLLSGLAAGMEPICSQAHGAHNFKLMGLTAQRTTLLLLMASLPIAALWLNTKTLLVFFNQSPDIADQAQTYILFSLPDLLAQSLLHPLRIYLRSQSTTLPLTFCAAFSILLHVPINYLLVVVLGLGVRGVALAGVWTNFNLVGSLLVYVYVSRVYEKRWPRVSTECLRGWGSLLSLAVPSCVSVCLEWWWYEIMILLCGLLADPRSTVASMGILIQTTALVYIFPSSLSFGVSTRVGNELGAGRPGRARRAARVGVSLGFGLGFLAFLFAFAVRNAWARMFTGEAEIVALTAAVLPIIGLCELGNCPQTAGCGVLRGSARPSLGANVNLACFYLVGMPVAVWLSFFKGLDFKGLWLGLLAAQLCCVAAMMFVVLGRTDWEFQAQRAKELTGSGYNPSDDDDDDDDDDDNVVAKLKEETLQQQEREREQEEQQRHCFDSPV